MTDSSEIISEYEAAALVAMSPDLLRWLTSYAPKAGVKTKLKVARREGDLFFYDRADLLSFDAFLRQPWPAGSGKRPRIPSKIRDEIRIEANGECAMCCRHGDKCEAAHLVPVATTQSNHPENLLWLCANHHTSYDRGHYGPSVDIDNFVGHQKTLLRRFRMAQWQMQARLGLKLISALETCALLSSQLERAPTADQIAMIETAATDFLAQLPAMAPVSEADPRHAEFEKLAFMIDELASDAAPVSMRLQQAAEIRIGYVAAMGMVACPLCDATGVHDGADCPVCDGDRQVDRNHLEVVDLDQFAKVRCPLCEGGGSLDGEDCRVCGGEGKVERRQAQWIDLRDYSQVECPICHGEKSCDGEDCRACCGEGMMERREAYLIDPRDYDVVTCRLCAGSGRQNGEECPACLGERRFLRRDADAIDFRDYEPVTCPTCEGSGRRRGDDCPVCNGNGSIERRFLGSVDVRGYDLVDCPACRNDVGRRDECQACSGEGEMERRFLDRISPEDYR